ncbi:CU044_2847 family protein [Amycolatopsis sp. H20-H5]|uniref:CU044_2847 family protein n=1 Tax=Amycolatopsis sp. H20-H5 TaxID=3046309 RepID=UPI002DB683CB|nr:CU044_2847 family protein [Amycolatopsis sp. H20-H5]MEC3982645.1 CU044_2847 family protein [Amycolatopsis sp. H20-H5]
MDDLTKFALEDGGSVIIEVEAPAGMTRVSRRDDLVDDTKASFERALTNVRDAASAALGQFQSMTRKPDEVEIKFGVKLTAEAGAVIAKTGLEGQFEVKLKWKRDPAAPADPA